MRNHGGGSSLLMPEEGIDFARSKVIGLARDHYDKSVARKVWSRLLSPLFPTSRVCVPAFAA